MSNHYKEVRNGNGTNLTIGPSAYISIGKDGKDIMIRCENEVIAFNSLNDLIVALDKDKSVYYRNDNDLSMDKQDIEIEKGDIDYILE